MKAIFCLRTGLLIIHLLAVVILQAQVPDLVPNDVLTIDGYNDSDVADLETDDAGNTYVAFNYSMGMTIPELNNQELPYAHHVVGAFMKLDPNGKPLWVHAISSSFDARIRDLSDARR